MKKKWELEMAELQDTKTDFLIMMQRNIVSGSLDLIQRRKKGVDMEVYR